MCDIHKFKSSCPRCYVSKAVRKILETFWENIRGGFIWIGGKNACSFTKIALRHECVSETSLIFSEQLNLVLLNKLPWNTTLNMVTEKKKKVFSAICGVCLILHDFTWLVRRIPFIFFFSWSFLFAVETETFSWQLLESFISTPSIYKTSL